MNELLQMLKKHEELKKEILHQQEYLENTKNREKLKQFIDSKNILEALKLQTKLRDNCLTENLNNFTLNEAKNCIKTQNFDKLITIILDLDSNSKIYKEIISLTQEAIRNLTEEISCYETVLFLEDCKQKLDGSQILNYFFEKVICNKLEESFRIIKIKKALEIDKFLEDYIKISNYFKNNIKYEKKYIETEYLYLESCKKEGFYVKDKGFITKRILERLRKILDDKKIADLQKKWNFC